VARGTTAAADLRQAIAAFLRESGDDRRYAALAEEARKLDTGLRQAQGGSSDQPTPGQRAAGVTDSTNTSSPRGGDTGSGSPSAKQAAAARFGGQDSAKGDTSNLPPFLRRQMKRGATARKGS
jgi:hypothetical protein